jgi:hypothetical protein
MGLDEKAAEAVAKWKSRPGLKDGVPVNVRTKVEVNFRIADPPPPISQVQRDQLSQFQQYGPAPDGAARACWD